MTDWTVQSVIFRLNTARKLPLITLKNSYICESLNKRKCYEK